MLRFILGVVVGVIVLSVSSCVSPDTLRELGHTVVDATVDVAEDAAAWTDNQTSAPSTAPARRSVPNPATKQPIVDTPTLGAVIQQAYPHYQWPKHPVLEVEIMWGRPWITAVLMFVTDKQGNVVPITSNGKKSDNGEAVIYRTSKNGRAEASTTVGVLVWCSRLSSDDIVALSSELQVVKKSSDDAYRAALAVAKQRAKAGHAYVEPNRSYFVRTDELNEQTTLIARKYVDIMIVPYTKAQ